MGLKRVRSCFPKRPGATKFLQQNLQAKNWLSDAEVSAGLKKTSRRALVFLWFQPVWAVKSPGTILAVREWFPAVEKKNGSLEGAQLGLCCDGWHGFCRSQPACNCLCSWSALHVHRHSQWFVSIEDEFASSKFAANPYIPFNLKDRTACESDFVFFAYNEITRRYITWKNLLCKSKHNGLCSGPWKFAPPLGV